VLKIGRKWSVNKSVVETKAALQIGDIVGQADLDQWLIFSPDIATTNLQPDIVL